MEPKIDIIIPSCKTKGLLPLIEEVYATSTGAFNLIIASNPEYSAAKNRNAGLMLSAAPYVIMVDDDITGLFKGWNEILISLLEVCPKVSIVSARLIRKDATPAPMMSSKYDLGHDYEIVMKIPTACIAFRQTAIRFDENFKGSGFEDDAFCLDMGPKIIINNLVKVVHLNEMKRQSQYWQENKEYFERTYANRLI
ncbi:MAG: glycosyltransferase family A protein [Candidatus Omnitrophica bacterium]|nr:glycosyltransferase family A protein [Candidatus Omnitrophota bacterium]MDD5592678.1 glycosyltransferase family A protein [Candidatus Omnitrophota bacterium]